MIRSIRDYLTRRVDPAPNPLRLTVSNVDHQIAALRADPQWSRDQAIRLQADRLLDVRTVLARHEEQDRRAATLHQAPPAVPATPLPHAASHPQPVRGLDSLAS